MSGWAGLGRFWLIVLVLLGAGAGVLQYLGPPPARIAAPVPDAKPTAPPPHNTEKTTEAEPPRPVVVTSPPAAEPVVLRPGRSIPGPVADPDPALQEPNTPPETGFLPRVAADGFAPMRAYAAGFDPTTRRPRVGLIIGGIGMNNADSLAAAKQMPAGVTLAVSPYAKDPERILTAARIAQHEYLLAIPMEPQGFPANDPDDRHALMTSLPLTENLIRLHWAMSRFGGYVGATNAFGPMSGERLSGMEDQFEGVLKDLAGRGLLFVDARPGTPPLGQAWNRSVDAVIDDDPADATSVDQRLEALARLAQEKGSALGLISLPRPATLDRVTAWANGLVEKGLVLAPVSALVAPPVASQGKARNE